MHMSRKLACFSFTQVVIQDLADAVMLVVTEYVCVVEELVSVEVVLPRQISAMLLFAMAFPEYKSHCILRMQRNSARSMRPKRPTRSQHNGREDRVSAYRALKARSDKRRPETAKYTFKVMPQGPGWRLWTKSLLRWWSKSRRRVHVHAARGIWGCPMFLHLELGACATCAELAHTVDLKIVSAEIHKKS